jgi:hypothetical protein
MMAPSKIDVPAKEVEAKLGVEHAKQNGAVL